MRVGTKTFNSSPSKFVLAETPKYDFLFARYGLGASFESGYGRRYSRANARLYAWDDVRAGKRRYRLSFALRCSSRVIGTGVASIFPMTRE